MPSTTPPCAPVGAPAPGEIPSPSPTESRIPRSTSRTHRSTITLFLRSQYTIGNPAWRLAYQPKRRPRLLCTRTHLHLRHQRVIISLYRPRSTPPILIPCQTPHPETPRRRRTASTQTTIRCTASTGASNLGWRSGVKDRVARWNWPISCALGAIRRRDVRAAGFARVVDRERTRGLGGRLVVVVQMAVEVIGWGRGGKKSTWGWGKGGQKGLSNILV